MKEAINDAPKRGRGRPPGPTKPGRPKPGPKPGAKADNSTPARPYLAAEWSHLREWWAKHGHFYNASAIAEAIGESQSNLSRLLRNTGSYKATAERLDAIAAVLANHYEAPNADSKRLNSGSET